METACVIWVLTWLVVMLSVWVSALTVVVVSDVVCTPSSQWTSCIHACSVMQCPCLCFVIHSSFSFVHISSFVLKLLSPLFIPALRPSFLLISMPCLYSSHMYDSYSSFHATVACSLSCTASAHPLSLPFPYPVIHPLSRYSCSVFCRSSIITLAVVAIVDGLHNFLMVDLMCLAATNKVVVCVVVKSLLGASEAVVVALLGSNGSDAAVLAFAIITAFMAAIFTFRLNTFSHRFFFWECFPCPGPGIPNVM